MSRTIDTRCNAAAAWMNMYMIMKWWTRWRRKFPYEGECFFMEPGKRACSLDRWFDDACNTCNQRGESCTGLSRLRQTFRWRCDESLLITMLRDIDMNHAAVIINIIDERREFKTPFSWEGEMYVEITNESVGQNSSPSPGDVLSYLNVVQLLLYVQVTRTNSHDLENQ